MKQSSDIMGSKRLKQLQEFYDEDPGDPFNLYALALEYIKHNSAVGRELFQQLLEKHPSYLPAYYQAAKLCVDLGEREAAIMIYEQGIELAVKLNEQKTMRELKSAYDELMFD